MNHLDKDTCEKLKAAGFPQTAVMAWFDEGCIHEGYAPSAAFAGAYSPDCGAIACPNSDELIAHIAEKYGFTCWQDIIHDLCICIRHAEDDLCEGLARYCIKLAINIPEDK